ncbi:MAG: protein-L-isoaspartate(D-aspartate) O-methyltransferase [Gemmatimonadetes bacterium]|nr:protein-L-isoaspartate(D-aspartate) O-methyltransferase [Gemmatimonadota bacterium]
MVREQIASPALGEYAVEDGRVLGAMRTVPRHLFVPPDLLKLAYADRPLPIGHGQTISQPFIVAAMTELLQVGPGDRILEIGTGSGYQAAVLAEIVGRVFTIEIVEPLAEDAEERLRRLGYDNVEVRWGDGYYGWEEKAPFQGIVVTAAASHIPPPLLEQLQPGGRMVIPVGPPLQVQTLMLVEKRPDGSIVQRSLMPVRFVPFTRNE